MEQMNESFILENNDNKNDEWNDDEVDDDDDDDDERRIMRIDEKEHTLWSHSRTLKFKLKVEVVDQNNCNNQVNSSQNKNVE